MATKDPVHVAQRCLCLELLFQRLALESDDEEPVANREKARAMWLSRLGDLGIDDALSDEERALLDTPVGALSEDDLDDLDGRTTGALVLAWALGRIDARPTFASTNAIAETLADHGLLGDGSITRARAAAGGARLRPDDEIEAARAAYERTRGKAREVADPEKIFAEIAAHHLDWVLDDTMDLEE